MNDLLLSTLNNYCVRRQVDLPPVFMQFDHIAIQNRYLISYIWKKKLLMNIFLRSETFRYMLKAFRYQWSITYYMIKQLSLLQPKEWWHNIVCFQYLSKTTLIPKIPFTAYNDKLNKIKYLKISCDSYCKFDYWFDIYVHICSQSS